jgi:hypothetical protein
MPAQLVPSEAIPKLAEQIDSAAMLAVLRYLRQVGFLFNSDVDQETAAIVRRLAALGLIDPGYDGPTNGRPFIWVRNGNGDQVLQYFERTFKPELKIHPRARPALASLSERDRQTVLGMAYYLRRSDPASWSPDLVAPLNPEKRKFLMRVTPELRAFLTVLDSGDIELTDLVREETLRLFRERQRDAATHQ